MVDIERIRELAELMNEHGLSEVRVREGETIINLRKGPIFASGMAAMPTMVPATASVSTPVLPGQAEREGPAEADAGLIAIKSPMVGTFYSASDPESPPFVRIGSEVSPDTPVCVIEAMKVFNEIKAEVTGTIERVLVQNDQAIEFGQPLMLVRPKS